MPAAGTAGQEERDEDRDERGAKGRRDSALVVRGRRRGPTIGERQRAGAPAPREARARMRRCGGPDVRTGNGLSRRRSGDAARDVLRLWAAQVDGGAEFPGAVAARLSVMPEPGNAITPFGSRFSSSSLRRSGAARREGIAPKHSMAILVTRAIPAREQSCRSRHEDFSASLPLPCRGCRPGSSSSPCSRGSDCRRRRTAGCCSPSPPLADCRGSSQAKMPNRAAARSTAVWSRTGNGTGSGNPGCGCRRRHASR